MKIRSVYNVIIVITAAITLSACQTMYEKVTRPRPWGMGDTPDGSPIFKQGWEDGCDTGLSTYGTDYYKWMYTYKQDMKLIDKPEYYRAWKDGYLYCRWYAWNWLRPFEGTL